MTSAWTRTPGPRLVTSLAIFAVGVLALIGGIVGTVAAFSPLFAITADSTSVTRSLSATTTYDVFVDSYSGVCDSSLTTVNVNGPDGSSVSTTSPATQIRFSFGSTTWCLAATFVTNGPGSYTASINDTTNSGRIAIVPSLGHLVLDALPGLGGIALSFVLIATGGIMAIVGLVRRKHASRRQFEASAHAAMWNPVPPTHDPRLTWAPPSSPVVAAPNAGDTMQATPGAPGDETATNDQV